jgi:hypothetical protein
MDRADYGIRWLELKAWGLGWWKGAGWWQDQLDCSEGSDYNCTYDGSINSTELQVLTDDRTSESRLSKLELKVLTDDRTSDSRTPDSRTSDSKIS